MTYKSVYQTTDITKKQKISLDGITSGDMFEVNVTAVTSSTGKWFLNIFSGSNIAYHIEFQESKDSYRINSKDSGTWGSKIVGKFPTVEGDSLSLKVTVGDDSYTAALNGEVLESFDHKFDIDTLNKYNVGGPAGSFVSVTQLRPDTTDASSGGSEIDAGDEEEQGNNNVSCFDYQLYCGYWQDEGFCDHRMYKKWMSKNCLKSCGLC